MDPPESLDEEFNDWYEAEHLAERLRVPGFLSARRVVRPTPPRYLACYDLEDLAVLESQAYLDVSGDMRSAWTARILGKTRLFDRRVFEQIFPGRELVVAAHPWTVIRTWRDRDEATVLAHTEAARALPGVAARCFAGRQPAAVAGTWLVLYTAATEDAARRCEELTATAAESPESFGACRHPPLRFTHRRGPEP